MEPLLEPVRIDNNICIFFIPTELIPSNLTAEKRLKLIQKAREAIQPKIVEIKRKIKKRKQLENKLRAIEQARAKLPNYVRRHLRSLKGREFEKLDGEKIHKRSSLICKYNQPKQIGPYKTGDLVWAKCDGFPYWPAMVVLDPVVRGKNKKPKYVRLYPKPTRYYFVQYFGSLMYRRWTPVQNLYPFEGWTAWNAQLNKDLETADSKERINSLVQTVQVNESLLNDWTESVTEANRACRLDRFKRIETFTYHYVDKIEVKEDNP